MMETPEPVTEPSAELLLSSIERIAAEDEVGSDAYEQITDATRALRAALAAREAELATLREAAKLAKIAAAAPDYDEECIKDALWHVVDCVLKNEGG